LASSNDEPTGVHGDIRHLEICESAYAMIADVHGDIRHLEIKPQ